MTDINLITEKLLRFRKEREWEQFHKPKDVAISLALEAAELLELFQWKNDAEVQTFIQQHSDLIRDELADVFNWILILAHDTKIDILQAAESKIAKNAKKYPIDKAKGNRTKYTHL